MYGHPEPEDTMAIDDRLLRVLRALNEIGAVTVLDLSRHTGISRAAIYRILETLCEAGYVRRIPGSALYQITFLVKALSSGYREQTWIAEAGAKAIGWLQEQVRWPTSLAVPERAYMVVRETTRFRSPFVFDVGTVGLTLPMFTSALGLAYYANCDAKSQKILTSLATDGAASDKPPLPSHVRAIARRGYATRIGGIDRNTGSIAVPLLSREGAVGAICVTYAKRAINEMQALHDFLPALRSTASRIMAAYEHSA
jgi:IclR family mhp operon transcriptional activator